MFYAKVLLLILSFYPFILNAQNATLTPLEDVKISEKDGKEYVLDKNGKPFAGSLQQTDEEGRTITYFYRNGLRNGIAFSYYEDGKIEFQITYRKGLKDGESMFLYENGKPKLKQTYKEGLLSGEEFIFYDNGSPEVKNNYLNGKLDGEIIHFDTKGNKLRVEHYKNGVKEGLEHIIKNNQLKEEHNYVNGEINGLSKIYDDEYLSFEIEYKNGIQEGMFKQYLKDGTTLEIPYKNGKKEGIGIAYYPDKKIANKATYRNDLKNGKSEKFYKNGTRNTVENYKNDKLEGIKRVFDESGKLKKVSYYIEDTELATVDVEQDRTLQEIYKAYNENQLNRVLSQKYKWYQILWLALNLENSEILDTLEKSMNMFASKLDDPKAYKRESKSQYSKLNRELFFGLTPLSYAINISAPTNILQRFATSPDQINEKNERGGTAFIEAVRLNSADNVKFLLLKGADLTKRYYASISNDTILLYAIKEKLDIPIIKQLIEHGADTNVADKKGKTPLLLAIDNNNTELYDTLIKGGAKMNNDSIGNMLLYAYNNNTSPKIINHIIDHIQTNNQNNIINLPDKDNNLLIMTALKKQDYDMITKLLSLGADVNIADKSGENALTFVLKGSITDNITKEIYSKEISFDNIIPQYQKTIWEILLEGKHQELLTSVFNKMESGAPDTEYNGIFAKANRKESPFSVIIKKNDNELFDIAMKYATPEKLHTEEYAWAILENNNFEMWDKFITTINSKEALIKGDEKNNNNEMLLHYLITNKYENRFIEKLLETIDKNIINTNNSDNQNSLDLAVKYDNPELFDMLYKKVAGPTNNLHLYLINLSNNQNRMAEVIINNGADVQYVDAQNMSVLMHAVSNLNLHLIELLLDKNVDTKVRDADGNTAIMYLANAIKNDQYHTQYEMVGNIEHIIELYKKKGLEINNQNGNGETLLMKIAQVSPEIYFEIKDYLVEQGINPDLKDQYGKTAEEYAKTNP